MTVENDTTVSFMEWRVKHKVAENNRLRQANRDKAFQVLAELTDEEMDQVVSHLLPLLVKIVEARRLGSEGTSESP